MKNVSHCKTMFLFPVILWACMRYAI